MKTTSIYSFVAAFIFVTLLTSCSFLQKGEFAQRKYYNFPRTKHAENETVSVVIQNKVRPQQAIAKEEKQIIAPMLSASANKKEIIASKTKSDDYITHKTIVETTNDAEPIESPAISFKKSEIKKQAIKNTDHFPSTDPDVMLIILVILAIVLPPLAVYLKDKEINKWFWITLLLCIFSGGIFFSGVEFGGLLWAIAVVIAILDVLDML